GGAARGTRLGDAPALPAGGGLPASGVNAKLPAAALVPAVLALLLLGGRPPSPRGLAGYAGIIFLLVSPWFAKSALTSGNPFFPLFSGRVAAGFATPDHLELRSLRLSQDFPTRRFVLRPIH